MRRVSIDEYARWMFGASRWAWLRRPRYRVEIDGDSVFRSEFQYLIWRGGKIVSSGYRFKNPVDAANAAWSVKVDLLNAWWVTR